ncbi:hypothetical protein H8D36_04610 [archaeon]|nr:hypothetical protein [archaeon]
MVTVKAIMDGYGEKFKEEFPDLDALIAIEATPKQQKMLSAPLPAMGRYKRAVSFLEDVTSGRNLGLKRFQVITEYFIALADELTKYKGVNKSKKVVCGLTKKQKNNIRTIATSDNDIVRAETLERFTNHDTAAAGDYIKLLIGHKLPELESMMEGVHFAATSEDVMGNVFGMIGNELVYGHFVPKILDFCDHLMNYAAAFDAMNKGVSIPGFTHDQAAEPHTLTKKFGNRVASIEKLLRTLITDGEFQPFSGKMGGAIGNLTTHYAAYPDINWFEFSENFVEELGLDYSSMTDQSTSYVVEAQILTTLGNIMTQMHKVTEDFVDLASSPGQLFTKKKKEGSKGSSIMPNKSNAWGMEGAQFMFEFARDKMLSYARLLPSYPHEGNMGRSYALRNLGDVFMDAFIGIGRVIREMNSYVPNFDSIGEFFDKYPGMAGSSIQTILKREGIEGDAYRELQKISMNPDGTYANRDQFQNRLENAVAEMGLSQGAKAEIMGTMNPENLVLASHSRAKFELRGIKIRFEEYRHMLTQYAPKETING